jgi:hypothetical protein
MLLGRHKSAFLSRPTSPTGNEPLTAIFRISDPSPVPLPASENLAKRELPVWFRVRQIQRSSGHPGPAEWRGTRRRQPPSSSAPVAAQLLRAGGRPPLVPRLAGPHSEGRAPRPPPRACSHRWRGGAWLAAPPQAPHHGFGLRPPPTTCSSPRGIR